MKKKLMMNEVTKIKTKLDTLMCPMMNAQQIAIDRVIGKLVQMFERMLVQKING